ncbi:FAD binding domain-containing protein [Pseudochelatococcus sp. B33]
MKPPPFEYFAPRTLSEAVFLLGQSENARVLAGGQSLMAMLNMRYVFPDRIIDLNTIPELDYIRQDGGDIVIGAMTRQRTLMTSDLVASHLPLIPKALRYVGHIQTRNRGTLGGSLCQLDPSAELPATAMACDAMLEATGPNGTRSIPFSEFPVMYMTPALEADEILTSVRFKAWNGNVVTGFREFSRRHGDFAIGGAAVALGLSHADKIERASVTLFGIADAPVRAVQAEGLLIGQQLSRELIVEASRLCLGLATLEDNYCSAEYRSHVAAAMAEDALREAASNLFS